MKKQTTFLLAIFLIGIASLMMYIGCYLSIEKSYGENYTEAYMIYKDLSSLNSIEEIEAYLVSNNHSYKINKNTLTLRDYEDIKFVLENNNVSGTIIACNECVMLSKLDEKDYEMIAVEYFIADEGEWVERIYFKQDNNVYSKVNDNYYINFTFKYDSLALISCIISVCTLSYSIGGFLFDLFQKKNKHQEDPY